MHRTYPGHLVQPGMPPPYEGTPSSHAHPLSRQGSILQSPVRKHYPIQNGLPRDPPQSDSRPQSKEVCADTIACFQKTNSSSQKPDRTSNPMSFASILGPSNNESSPTKQEPELVRKLSTPSKTLPLQEHQDQEMEQPQSDGFVTMNGVNGVKPSILNDDGTASVLVAKPELPPKPRKVLSKSESDRVFREMATIEDTAFSDTEAGDFEQQHQLYREKTKKRARQVGDLQEHKRKVSCMDFLQKLTLTQHQRRRTHLLDEFAHSFGVHSATASARFRDRYHSAAAQEIADRDHQSEKERKKDMQRKRRRDAQIRSETEKLDKLAEAIQTTDDPAERELLQRQFESSEARIRRTIELNNGLPDELDVPPINPNYEGGMTSSFHLATPEPDEPPKKRVKQGAGPSIRPKKSKEKKQAEKDAAEAAYAAMERDSMIPIAPKEEERRDSIRYKRSKDHGLTTHAVNYDSKGYNQIYEQIWRDMSRKDVPKVFRIKQLSLSTRQENMRKTAILASKQARKWQERTNKSMKDTQARAKRVMREMMSFWKRNEREERDLRRTAERKEIEDAKKAEADREANRQKRKLNFLISQTELYSHFIGRKIKTDEIENSTNDPDVALSGKTVRPGVPNAHTVNLPPSVADLTRKTTVTNFEDLDFDAEDETALQQAAMANAQSAIQDAQDRAKAFNGDDQMAAFDHSDMNFQNPTMAGDVQVSQPKMLQAQLKEYQLKGLNWLVNLYEQGINGILADEMGLGKTVQSISVMGYLAEQHNVWGPFLVIAPSSTLHNWQQEITRFVPTLKVLPYWGNAKDRKTLRKFWDRKHITYSKESEFHVLVTSYQLVVQDAQYFQKIKWQYMILDEAQAIKSSSSSRWKILLQFHCRNRLLLTGTPIQNNMQELWALLHFIMPTLFDSHDEFSDWFSKDIESHAQSNTKLNQDQLKRLHMILKPFMLRRVKAHVQKELGDKVEKDVFCDLTYRQRAYYANLRSKISIMDLLEKATLGDDQDAATLMNLVMQFRKVCNHPDLFERADVASPFSLTHFAETASFLREGHYIQVGYSIRNHIQLDLPRILCDDVGRLDIAGPNNSRAGFMRAGCKTDYLGHLMRIWTPEYVKHSSQEDGAFSFLRFADASAGEACDASNLGLFERAIKRKTNARRQFWVYEDAEHTAPAYGMFNIIENDSRRALAELDPNSALSSLYNVSTATIKDQGLNAIEPAARPRAVAPPIEISCFDQSSMTEKQLTMFNTPVRNALYPIDELVEEDVMERDVGPCSMPISNLLPAPECLKSRYTDISVPSMRRFVTDCGKLAKLDHLLRELKRDNHRVLLYFQMTKMIDLMEEYLTYRNYKYCRLDGSTKLEDRRDTVHDFQTQPDIFIFLLSTRAGGLGINLTAADTVIFYDSDWNPTIDSQAMDRAHRLGQTRQVTVYRLITKGTIEERIRKRALQKEEVQRVVITGGDGGGVDFNTRDRRENRTKDIAMWLADDDQAAVLEQKEKEAADKPEEEGKVRKSKKAIAAAGRKKKGEMSLDDMYHEGECPCQLRRMRANEILGEGHFEDASAKASGAVTPVSSAEVPPPKRGPRGGAGKSKKAKTAKQRLAIIDAEGDLGMGGGS
jgi:chromatin-remodeling ATPase INO80